MAHARTHTQSIYKGKGASLRPMSLVSIV